MTEIWKDIVGYEKYYKVSNLGRVYSIRSQKILSQTIETVKLNDYIYQRCKVSLCVNNKPKVYKVHILVAQAFIPNPNNLPTVDHIDCNGLNNCVDNLRWADMTTQTLNRRPISCSENHKTIMTECSKGNSNAKGQHKKFRTTKNMGKHINPIIMCDKNTHEPIKIFNTIKEAREYLGIGNKAILVQKCVDGLAKSSQGYWWKYLNKTERNEDE
jgi:hypothetical protein